MRIHCHDTGDLRGADRAREYGARFASEIATAAVAYRTQFRVLGLSDRTVREIASASHAALGDWAPALAAELESMAEGAGVALQDVIALTARTEIMASASPIDECSTVVHAPTAGDPVAFQTWDWHAHLVPDATVWSYRTDAGRAVTTFTEPGMPAKIGINGAGLSVNFNILHHRSDGHRTGGVPVHALARRILDDAGSVAEAVELVRSAPVIASSVFTVVAQHEAAAIEVSPAGVGVVRPDADGWLVHTNHFLDPALASGGVVAPTSTTNTRFKHLVGAVAGTVDTGSLPALATAFGEEAGQASPICVRSDDALPAHERWQTLLTTRLVPAVGEFEWWAGAPFTGAMS